MVCLPYPYRVNHKTKSNDLYFRREGQRVRPSFDSRNEEIAFLKKLDIVPRGYRQRTQLAIVLEPLLIKSLIMLLKKYHLEIL